MAGSREAAGERILVVDDDETMCQMLAEILAKEGYCGCVCTDPEEALSIAEQDVFSLAFVDINMPTISGLDLAAKLKESDPRREVVFITGSGAIDDAVQAIKIGANDFLRKPFSVTEFTLCLRRFQERKALRNQIVRAERRYFDLVQNVPLLIYVLHKNLQLDFINHACFHILGYSPDEAISTPDWFVGRIHFEDRDRITKLVDAAFESGGASFSAECRFIHKKGHVINTIVKSIPPYGDPGQCACELMEGIIVDITDRVFLERALVQREKLKTLGAISAEVAHEIRNPLVSIGGFARRLLSKYPDLPEANIIVRESERLEKILGRIKDYLKPVEVFAEECSINEIIHNSIDLLAPEIEQRSVECRLDLEPALPAAIADPEILSQVCINLIRNAIDSVEEGGSLAVRSFQSDHSVHADFKHPHQGSRTKNPELVFLPFDEGGESIGLPLCHRLLKNMGGVLSFSEDADYAVFTVSLPKKQ
ncbi:MAG: response regulator [Desulforhabdus sp.]|jgi:PAS domain S-box-containing protein|nr:response regulator [Desulforhabdus sp.]